MIKTELHRIQLDPFYDHGSTHQTLSVEEAFTHLTKWELGFGGTVVDISPTRVVVKTRVFGKMDTSTFEGLEQEMQPLVWVAAAYAQSGVTTEDICEKLRALCKASPAYGNPLILDLAYGPVLGRARLKKIVESVGVPYYQQYGNPIFLYQASGIKEKIPDLILEAAVSGNPAETLEESVPPETKNRSLVIEAMMKEVRNLVEEKS